VKTQYSLNAVISNKSDLANNRAGLAAVKLSRSYCTTLRKTIMKQAI